MLNRKLSTTIALITLVALSLWLAGGKAVAAPSPVQVTPLPPGEQQAGKPVTLGAKVVDTTINRPVGGIDVVFFVETDVFGIRLMNVGHAATDATGSAYVLYKPSWEGETKVVARFAGNSQYAAGEGSLQFSAIGPARLHENARFGLEPVRAAAPFVVIAVVLAVWTTLVLVLVRTVRDIGFADTSVVTRTVPARGAVAREPVE